MKTYPLLGNDGKRAPIFEVENAYISPADTARVLSQVEGVKDVRRRKMFAKPSDIHVYFKYMGQPYIVLEPYGDNSRYWIGPADMVAGTEDVPNTQTVADLERLEEAFRRYKPPLYRTFIGDLITLRFITRLIKAS